jgi:hypothetical protein
MRILMAAALAASGFACARHSDEVKYDVLANGFTAVDLISPATCQLQLGKLRQCAIAPVLHDAPPMDTAVPLRTVARRQISGNCSTQFPLAVAIALDDAPGTNLAFLSQSQLTLRQPGGGVASRVSVSDASPWTGTAVFADSCRVSLTITANEIDVDTVQQAEAILASIEQELAAAALDVRNYETLLALQAAYSFTRAVAESFHQELTNATMQVLRQEALDAAPALQIAALACSESLSQEQRDTLFELLVSMVALGDPAAWQNPDGSTRTLEQFYGPGAAEVLAQLEELASQANPDLETEFRLGLEAAAAEHVRLQQKRALAIQQLAPWLGGEP